MIKNIILLGLTSFLNDVSSEIINSILPAFLVSIGVGTVGFGLVSGVGEFFANIFKIFSGFLSDKIKRRKPIIFLGYLTSSLSKAILPFSSSILHVISFKIFDRTGKGVRTSPRDALISESTEKTGFGFGIHRALDTLGAIVGSIIVVTLFWLGFKKLFFLSVFIAFLSLIPLFFVEDIKRKMESSEKTISIRNLTPIFLFSFGNISYMFFLYHIIKNFGSFYSFLFYFLFNIAYAVFSIPFGILSDKIGKRNVLLMSYVMFGIFCMLFSRKNNLLEYSFLFFLYGIFHSIKDGVERAYVSEKVGRTGKAYGIYHFGIGIISLVSNIIFGILLQIFDNISFLLPSFISFLSATSLIILIK